jgi:hypothetical protein
MGRCRFSLLHEFRAAEQGLALTCRRGCRGPEMNDNASVSRSDEHETQVARWIPGSQAVGDFSWERSHSSAYAPRG